MTEVLHNGNNIVAHALPGEAFPRASSFLDRMKQMSKMDIHRGDDMVGDYIIGDKLGQGSFGKVMLGTHIQTKQKVALKFIDYSKTKNQKERDNIKREVRLMQLLDHPNIVKLLEVIEQRETTCLVLEYIAGGELFDYIVSHRRLKEPEAIRFFRQVVQGLEYCHSNLVIHRDLKPENLLLDANNNIKINDFGLSNMMSPGSFLTTYCGSPLYSSPEIILETNYIGPEVDVWALGVILYAMVTGYLPWDGDTLKQQVHNAVKARYEVPPHVSMECKDLIGRCLCIDPKQRATIPEIRVHPWLSKGYNAPPLSCLPAKREVKEMDMEIVDKLVDMGFERSAIATDLYNNKTMKPTWVLYWLMLDKKNKEMADQMKLDLEKESKATISKAAMPSPKKGPSLTAIPEDNASVSHQLVAPSQQTSNQPRASTPVLARKNTANRMSWGPNSKANGNIQIPILPSIAENNSHNVSNTNSSHTSPSSSPQSPTPHSSNVTPIHSPKTTRKSAFLKLFSRKEGSSKTAESSPEPEPDSSTLPEYPEIVQNRTRRATIDMGEAPKLDLQQTLDLDKNLRVSKGAFTVETTTMKPVSLIKDEVERVLGVLNMTYKHTKKGVGYSCKWPNSKVEVDIEICKIDKLDGIKGLKLKRASGDVWEYKDVYHKFIAELKL